MDNKQATAEWIAKQREAICVAMSNYDIAGIIDLANTAFPAALDALEASMQREAKKDATIARLTAERDAAVCDMFGCMSTQGQCVRCKKRYYCDVTDDDKFSPLCKNNSHCYAWEWRGLHADNTDAPTGAESDPIKDVNMKGISIHNCGDVKSQKIISIKTMDDNIDL